MKFHGRVCLAFVALGLAIGSVPGRAAEGEAAADPAAEAAAAAIAEARAAISVTGAWTRATPGNATNAAVYLRIANAGTDPERLIGVRAEMSETAQLHSGGATMAAIEGGLTIPPGETVAFEPNGNHVMLMGLRAPLKEGDSFLIQLEFETGGSQTVAVPIAAANAMAAPAPVMPSADITSGATGDEPEGEAAPQ
jgi:copper(I)-binding protein